MSLQTRQLRMHLLSVLGTPLAGATVTLQLSAYQADGVDIVPLVWALPEDPDVPGDYVGPIWPNTRGDIGTHYAMLVQANGQALLAQQITVAEDAVPAVVQARINPPPYPPVYAAQLAVQAANTFADASGESASIAMAVAERFGLVGDAIDQAEDARDDAIDAAQQAGAIRYKVRAVGVDATAVDGYFRVERGGIDALARDTLYRRTATTPFYAFIGTSVDGGELDVLQAQLDRANEQRIEAAAEAGARMSLQTAALAELSSALLSHLLP